MIDIDIPGYKRLALSHLVLDFNGTLAHDGMLQAGVRLQLLELAAVLDIHVVTGNTFGTAQDQLHGLPCRILLLEQEGQARAKREFVCELGADATAAIGNGRNDTQMMAATALSIAVAGHEGAACAALAAADIAVASINDALGMLQHPKRLLATLRA